MGWDGIGEMLTIVLSSYLISAGSQAGFTCCCHMIWDECLAKTCEPMSQARMSLVQYVRVMHLVTQMKTRIAR